MCLNGYKRNLGHILRVKLKQCYAQLYYVHYKIAGKCWLKITAPCNAYRNHYTTSRDEFDSSLKVNLITLFFGAFAVQDNIYGVT